MAFFERLGKKISDAGHGAAQSGRNAMDIAKLNGSINEKHKEIAQGFSALGEEYYRLHKEDAEYALASAVNNISVLYAQIQDCEEQIKTIRGVVKCPNCGGDISLSAAFCSACGAPAPTRKAPSAPAAPPEGTRECPNCHKFMPVDNKFCTGCGTRLSD